MTTDVDPEAQNGPTEPELASPAPAPAPADPEPEHPDQGSENIQPDDDSEAVPTESIQEQKTDPDASSEQVQESDPVSSNESPQQVVEPVVNAVDEDSESQQQVVEPVVNAVDEDSESQQQVVEPVVNASDEDSKLSKAVGNRTFTMRELLNELKSGDANGDPEANARESDTPRSVESTQQQIDRNSASMELIDRVTGADEEGRSRNRILTFAARRYASALERNPEDYDALYNWALVLQESADNVGQDSGSTLKDEVLEEACKKYEEATRLCPTLNDAYYNWAIAISDRAKIRGRTKEAEEFWKQASKNYEKAVQLNWNSPQALNNWGLALQELSAIVPAREKQNIVRSAISKFRAAIQLQFDFHRAIYNLGTVLYGLAEDVSRAGVSINAKHVDPNELYSQSAIYIAAAHALKPNFSVYNSALKLVRSMLPLPYLKVGYLTAPPAGTQIAPHGDWRRTQFVLDHEGLHQILKAEQKQLSHSLSSKEGDSGNTSRAAIKVSLPDIVSVSSCADLTLPPGAGLCIDTINGPVFLMADSWESLDGWLDAIRLVYTIFARGKSDVLAGIIAS